MCSCAGFRVTANAGDADPGQGSSTIVLQGTSSIKQEQNPDMRMLQCESIIRGACQLAWGQIIVSGPGIIDCRYHPYLNIQYHYIDCLHWELRLYGVDLLIQCSEEYVVMNHDTASNSSSTEAKFAFRWICRAQDYLTRALFCSNKRADFRYKGPRLFMQPDQICPCATVINNQQNQQVKSMRPERTAVGHDKAEQGGN